MHSIHHIQLFASLLAFTILSHFESSQQRRTDAVTYNTALAKVIKRKLMWVIQSAAESFVRHNVV